MKITHGGIEWDESGERRRWSGGRRRRAKNEGDRAENEGDRAENEGGTEMDKGERMAKFLHCRDIFPMVAC